MSEVKKWYIGVYGGEAQARPCSPAEFEIINEREGRYFVLKEDFDRVTAERDALQVLLTAADERADVLEGMLISWLKDFGRTHSGLQRLKERTQAALKPAEGGGDA